MVFNWLVLPALGLALALFGAGQGLWRRGAAGRKRALLLAAGVLLAVPGLLMPLHYLVPGLGEAAWFCEFRSWPGVELAAGGAGLLAGLLAAALAPAPGPRALLVRSLFLAVVFLGVIAPHVKPLLAPLPPAALRPTESWAAGVCRQSTPASCGPACVATLLKAHGREEASEAQLRRECFTYRGGTENWYLARALRRRGLSARYLVVTPARLPDPLPAPAIAGVRLAGGIGHFIPILGQPDRETYEIGDPLHGRQRLTLAELQHAYEFTGFFLLVGR